MGVCEQHGPEREEEEAQQEVCLQEVANMIERGYSSDHSGNSWSRAHLDEVTRRAAFDVDRANNGKEEAENGLATAIAEYETKMAAMTARHKSELADEKIRCANALKVCVRIVILCVCLSFCVRVLP